MAPAVSVIIRTYNRAVLLQQAIQSVLGQTFQDFEIIVVNNSSTDNTIEVVKSFKDERIRIINTRNKGIIAKSRNVGLKESQGDYIAFLDDDDLWCPEKLEIQVEYLRKHPEYYLVYSNAWIIDETGARKGLIMDLELFKEGEIFKYLVKCNFIPQLTVLMKREVFDNIGFFNEDHSVVPVDDYEYWLRVALQYKIGFVEEPLARYRVHSGGMSRAANLAPAQQKILFSLLEDPSVPNKNKIEERVYELYYPSAMYNWTNSANVAAKKELREYLSYNLRHANLTNVFKALRFGVLFNFKYSNLKRIKNWILNQRS